MNSEKPQWQRGDTLRSLKEIAKVHLAQLVLRPMEWLDRKDSELANAINTEEDEAA